MYRALALEQHVQRGKVTDVSQMNKKGAQAALPSARANRPFGLSSGGVGGAHEPDTETSRSTFLEMLQELGECMGRPGLR